ncbi:maltase A2-like [Amphiura filiformis]|uniref:maltase A2-like n=1 Tax=Amphiura filiformis TaxID=82378 RepID=UPI003B226214
MGDYSEIHNGTDDRIETNQEHFALYDPGPLETTEENWDSWHGEEVRFNRRDGDIVGGTCCRNCTSRLKSRRTACLVFSCFIFIICTLFIVLATVMFGSISFKSSPKYDVKWYESAVGYQIFPRSFQDSDGDGIGDLKGITSRLDYLEYLGIEVIWLCTINPSPYTHIGLDITNFTGIDPPLGDMNDFQMLIQAVHEKGMKLVLEFVPNHSSKDHYWFQQSRQSKANPYHDFYIWADGISESEPPNDWKDTSGNSNWKYEPSREQWYHHSFLESEPSLNYDSPYVQIAMTDALQFWLEQGIDGVYIRHVNHLLGTSEIHTDQNGFQEYTVPNYNDTSRPRRASLSSSHGSLERAKSIVQKWRKIVTNSTQSKKDHKLLVVDTQDSSLAYATALYGSDKEPLADYPFNYALFDVNNQRTTGHTIRYFISQWLMSVPQNALTNWALGSPEISRISTRYEPQYLHAITMLTLALPGSPLLYYGDEISMMDVPASTETGNVPYGPMQWDSGDYAGFTDGNETWIDVANNSINNNIKVQKANDSSLLNLIRQMIKLRHQEPALGNFSEKVHLYDLHSMRELIIFVRHPRKPGSAAGLLFVANIRDYEVTENYPLIVKSTKLPDIGDVVMATNISLIETQVNLTQLKLLSGEAVIVKFQSK